MRIRKETDYAISAIKVLIEARGEALLSKEIAASASIPPKYVLSIMCKLKNTGIVDVIRSSAHTRNGYVMKADPYTLTLYDVVHVFEGNIVINACLKNDSKCPNRKTCLIHDEMVRVNDALIASMKQRTVGDVVLNGGVLGK